jgi:MFS family permease
MHPARGVSEQVLAFAEVRRAMRLANANAALWATGNGLVSTGLVTYLATTWGAQGLAISLILAAPRFAGLLRLVVPALMAGLRQRKGICLAGFVVSAVVLCTIPAAAIGKERISQSAALTALVAAWCLYHLFEYIAAVALWSWLGDLTPRRIRGRLLGYRERWLVAGRVVGLVTSAALAAIWGWLSPNSGRWQPLAISATAGAAFMALAIAPLWLMPAAQHTPSAIPSAPWRSLWRALEDPAYRRLLIFNGCFSLVNGLPAAAQEMFPIRVLGVTYVGMQSLRGLMRIGQFSIAPWVGGMVDRWGNRPIMIVAQLIVATGSLFYLAATPDMWWLLIGAHLVWIAYVALNVGLDNVKLKLAPPENNAPYLAVYQALSDFVNGLTIVAGGLFIDQRLRTGGSDALALYSQIFLCAWIGRTLLASLLARLIEPGARPLSEILNG